MKKSIIIASLLLSGCVGGIHPSLNHSIRSSSATITTYANPKLFQNLPDLDGEPIPIAVYSFTDRTGQRKSMQTVSSFSTAVTQGADAYVVKTLHDVGNGKIGRAHV